MAFWIAVVSSVVPSQAAPKSAFTLKTGEASIQLCSVVATELASVRFTPTKASPRATFELLEKAEKGLIMLSIVHLDTLDASFRMNLYETLESSQIIIVFPLIWGSPRAFNEMVVPAEVPEPSKYIGVGVDDPATCAEIDPPARGTPVSLKNCGTKEVAG